MVEARHCTAPGNIVTQKNQLPEWQRTIPLLPLPLKCHAHRSGRGRRKQPVICPRGRNSPQRGCDTGRPRNQGMKSGTISEHRPRQRSSIMDQPPSPRAPQKPRRQRSGALPPAIGNTPPTPEKRLFPSQAGADLIKSNL